MGTLDNKTILVTGGTGTFGRKFVEILLREHSPKKLIVFSRDELKQHEMRQLVDDSGYSPMRYFIGDVRDANRLRRAFNGVDIVVHAAALKQVPACEYNPIEAVATNIDGARNIIDAAIDCGVPKVLAISTDKAVAPINLYGATKLVAEKLFVQGNAYAGIGGTRFSCVRYGNVVGSRGSVVPLFMEQRKTGKITITDPTMTRFWITTDQGVRFVISSLETMDGGEIFVPKIPSMSMADLATAIAPGCEVRTIGMRPGEKLHEILIAEDEARNTVDHEDRFIILPAHPWWIQDRWNEGQLVPDGFTYTSANNPLWLTPDQLRNMVSDEPGPEVPAARVPMMPYGHQTVSEQDIRAVESVLRSGWLTTGPKVSEFEAAFARETGADYAVAVSSGTAALHATMAALNIGPGDEVIVPAITFAATANCVLYQGGTPVFADVRSDTLLIDPEDVQRKITGRTKAIIAVDYAGQPCDYDVLNALAVNAGLGLVADSCHALGGSYHGRPVGALADLSIFSFHPVKNLTTGEGGMITTQSAEFAQRMRAFRNHGISTDHHQRAQAGSFAYDMVSLGYNYRLTDFQCALGLSQLRRLRDWIERRQSIARRYDAAFEAVPFILPLESKAGISHAYHLYVVRLSNNCVIDRGTLFEKLRAEHIGVNVHYQPVYLHSYYQEVLGLRAGLCPIAEEAYSRIISLPIFPAMSDEEVDTVVAAVTAAVSS